MADATCEHGRKLGTPCTQCRNQGGANAGS